MTISADVTSMMVDSSSPKIRKTTADKLAVHLHALSLFIYKRVKVKLEFANLAWTNPDTRRLTCPNIVQMTDNFNKVSYWTASEILTSKDKKSLKRTIRKFIEVKNNFLFFRDFFDRCRLPLILGK